MQSLGRVSVVGDVFWWIEIEFQTTNFYHVVLVGLAKVVPG